MPKRYSATSYARRGAKQMKKTYNRKSKYSGMSRKAYSLRIPRFSGGAPRIQRFSRMGIDKMIANQTALNFTTFNTNGILQSFNQVNMGITQSSFNNTVRFAATLTYSFSDIARASEFAILYSQYRITGVKVTIIPMYNQTGPLSLSSIGECSYAHDYADETTVTDENELLEMQGAVSRRLDKPFSFFIKPRPRTLATDYAANNVQNAAELNGGPFMDLVTAPDIPHYATKMYFNNINAANTSTANIIFKIRTKYYFECKDTT